MSRRVRTKLRRQPMQMGTNHHSQYSSTTTCYPSSYSIFGSPISIPTKLLPLHHNNKINYIFSEGELLQVSNPVSSLSEEECSDSIEANLTICGNLIESSAKYLSTLLFVMSMACFCCFKLFRSSYFRSKIYSRYRISVKEYLELAKLIEKLHSCSTLILNIQDNELTKQKVEILESAIVKSMGQPSSNLYTVQKKVIIRNYCYYMKELQAEHIFEAIKQSEIQGFFVWEDFIVFFKPTLSKGDEEIGLLEKVFHC